MWKEPPLPQLLMWFPEHAELLIDTVPSGYAVRSYLSGDEDRWGALLNANGELGKWDRARIEGELTGALQPAGQFFAVAQDDALVACAGVYDRIRSEQSCWEIGWIAAHPDHRGRGLGRLAATYALNYARITSPRPIFLRTDDGRLPALKTYLKMGFIPDIAHPSYVNRWRKVIGKLGTGYAQYEALLQKG
jgi:mycothiol synthase